MDGLQNTKYDFVFCILESIHSRRHQTARVHPSSYLLVSSSLARSSWFFSPNFWRTWKVEMSLELDGLLDSFKFPFQKKMILVSSYDWYYESTMRRRQVSVVDHCVMDFYPNLSLDIRPNFYLVRGGCILFKNPKIYPNMSWGIMHPSFNTDIEGCHGPPTSRYRTKNYQSSLICMLYTK